MRLETILVALLSVNFASLTFALSLPLVNSLSPSNLTLPQRLEAYEVNCVRISDPPMTGLSPMNCAELVPIICNSFNATAAARPVRNKWIWRELPECALGFYLPEHAPVPRVDVCNLLIFGEIVEMCATKSRFNGGEINVDALPDFGSNGSAVDPGEARFLMAPERMTL